MRKLTSGWRPSPAMTVAVIAVIIGLGGTAIAANLSRSDVNKIVKKQINKNKVRAKSATTDKISTGNSGSLSTRIRANQKGHLHIVGTVWALALGSSDSEITCRLDLNGSDIDFTIHRDYVPLDTDGDATCATNAVVPVNRGRHQVRLEASRSTAGANLDNANLSVLFVP